MQPTPQPRPPRRDWRRRWAWIVFPVIAAGLTAAALLHIFTRAAPLDRLKDQIRSEVPVGSTCEQVDAWAKERWGQTAHVSEEPFPGETGHTLPEAAGVPDGQRKTVLDVTIPCGQYRIRGEVAPNHLGAFFPLDDDGRVTGHYFLTLEELAAIERRRTP